MKTYARVKKQYARLQGANVVEVINFKQVCRVMDLKAKGLIPQELKVQEYAHYKAIILDLKAKGLIQ